MGGDSLLSIKMKDAQVLDWAPQVYYDDNEKKKLKWRIITKTINLLNLAWIARPSIESESKRRENHQIYQSKPRENHHQTTWCFQGFGFKNK